jgi:DNA-binding transcriptional regulator YhcF (GntR family)
MTRGDDLLARIAGVVLGANPGDRLPTLRSLAADHGVSVGAAQAALARFEAIGAVQIESRERQGAILRQRVIGAMWFEAE